MRARWRGTIVGASALTLALAIFFVSLIQVGILMSEATAQSSSVRPPDSALLPEDGPIVEKPGGSVRLPAPVPSDAPAVPGQTRDLNLADEMSPAQASTPLSTLGPNSDADLWSSVRHGVQGTVSIPDRKAGTLVQSFGHEWERLRSADGPLFRYGGYALGGIVVLLLLFYILRGRIRIEHGRSGVLIERFKPIERFGHWLLAGSFILLALTGLNLLYGKELLMPLIGKEAFSTLTIAGKWIHNNVAWAFMLGLVMVFVMWVVHNLPSRHDVMWVLKGGGVLFRGVHPHAKKFNAGQKLIFWGTILLGVSVSLSGLSLLFPYEMPMFGKTFEILNGLGAAAIWGSPLPTDLSPLQEMQYAQIWHTIVALAMIVMIIAHIYIGTLGMEGAFDAMGTGMVDRNWALEHHDLWVEEVESQIGRPTRRVAATPAE